MKLRLFIVLMWQAKPSDRPAHEFLISEFETPARYV